MKDNGNQHYKELSHGCSVEVIESGRWLDMTIDEIGTYQLDKSETRRMWEDVFNWTNMEGVG